MNTNSTVCLVEDHISNSKTDVYTARDRTRSVDAEGLSVVAFFPGLGSRSAYRDIDQKTIEGMSPAAAEVYAEAAQALGQVPTPRSLATDAKSLPEDPVERQGYVGAALATGAFFILLPTSIANSRRNEYAPVSDTSAERASVAAGSPH